MLEPVAQRDCGCSIPGGVHSQDEWGPGKPDLVLDLEFGNPACSGGLDLKTLAVPSHPSHSDSEHNVYLHPIQAIHFRTVHEDQ